MEIVGSVAPDEVPEGKRLSRPIGQWPTLVARAVADHESGRVTVIKVKDEKEYRRFRNGTALIFRAKTKYRLNPVIVEQPDGWRVFLELQLREQEDGGS
jgi:hypothetical protein